MAGSELFIPVENYDLSATLSSGQAFRWKPIDTGWEGVIGRNWVRLEKTSHGINARTATAIANWTWLRNYLQTDTDLEAVLSSFPQDAAMTASVEACRGLRLLRQDPWECLASFILSSTKQIIQIQQIVALLCERYGEPVPVRAGHRPEFAFPSARRLAEVSELELRACKMGFRAPSVMDAAEKVASGELDLEALRGMPMPDARAQLEQVRGVGPKIANCVLLFAYGFQGAFPVDVWVMKALRDLYFPRRRPKEARILQFANSYFGPNAGYAQQYLFHYRRTRFEPRISALKHRSKKRQ